MAENTHLEMHRDHQQWLGDISMWRDDVALWKDHTQKTLVELTQFEAALRQLLRSIQDHEAGLNQHVGKINIHQHSVSEFERTGEGDTVQLLTLAKAHKAESAGHDQQRRAHEQLKKDNHTVMVHWNRVLQAMAGSAK
jgi:hypothetical protein